jgi:hypothetical protein
MSADALYIYFYYASFIMLVVNVKLPLCPALVPPNCRGGMDGNSNSFYASALDAEYIFILN